jgi:hypothetical protein
MEGARRLDEWTRLESRIPSPDCVPVLAPPDGSEGRIDLRPQEWELLAHVDGERDLRLIASDLGRSAFDVAKIAYGLTSMNLLRIRDRPVPVRNTELGQQLEALETLLQNGDLATAEQEARELQKSHPDRAELAVMAGRALAGQGRAHAAAASFDRR